MVNSRNGHTPRSPRAWVVLLTSPWYLPGVIVLAYSLRKVQSKYPLIVAVTPSLPKEEVNALVEFGLDIEVVELLRPRTKVSVVAHRFEDTWTKLVVFGFEGFQVNIHNLPRGFRNSPGRLSLTRTFRK